MDGTISLVSSPIRDRCGSVARAWKGAGGRVKACHSSAMSTERFDVKAATWDADPDKLTQAGEVAGAIRAAVPLNRSMRLLEYGAGTGLVSQGLAGSVGPLTLADNSAGMRAVMQAKVASGALMNARVWDLDLQARPVPADTFDLIVTSLVLHHVRDLDSVLAGFAQLLVPGGYLAVADLDAEDGSFHDHDFDGHHGFDRGELTGRLTSAGFADVRMQDCTRIDRDGTGYSVFLATARRTE